MALVGLYVFSSDLLAQIAAPTFLAFAFDDYAKKCKFTDEQ